MPLAIAALACSAGGAGGAGAPPAREPGFPRDATVRRDPGNGTIRFLSGPDLSRDLERDPAFRAARADGDAAAIARAFLAAYAAAFRLERPGDELAVREVRADRGGRRIVLLDQRWRGVPVLRGELRVHLDAEGRVVVVNGSTVPTPRGVDPEPALGRPAGGCSACRAELVIAAADGAPRLAWRVHPPRGALHDELVLDARSGAVLERVPVALPGALPLAPEEPR